MPGGPVPFLIDDCDYRSTARMGTGWILLAEGGGTLSRTNCRLSWKVGGASRVRSVLMDHVVASWGEAE